MNSPDYFYRDKTGREIGPFDLVTLAKFRLAGVLNGDTPVRAIDSADWKSCREVVADASISSVAAVNPTGAVKISSTGLVITLLAVIVVVLIAMRSGPPTPEPMGRSSATSRLSIDSDTKEQPRAPSVPKQALDDLAGEAEQRFRKQFDLERTGMKLVFRGMDGQKVQTSGVEGYVLKCEAEIEALRDTMLDDIYLRRGERVTFALEITGEKTDAGWNLVKSGNSRIVGASSTSLFSKIKKLEDSAKKNSCIANLKQIDGAVQQWAVENKRPATAVPRNSDIFGASLYIRSQPFCPLGGVYTLRAVSEAPQCSVAGHTL